MTNLGTFFEDWWDITQAGVPPKELQYEPPPANIGPAAQSLVDNLCQRTGSSRKDICRRIAHNLNLVGNIKKFAALGSEKAVASKNKKSKKKISKKQKSKKRERTPDIEDEDYQAIGEEDSDQNEQPELYDEDKLGESGEEEDQEEQEEQEYESDVDDVEAAEVEGRPSWSVLNRLRCHELQAVASAFLTADEHKHTPQMHADMASYLAVTGNMPLPHFDVFVENYRLNYVPPKRNTRQLRLVEEAAAAQEQQQLVGVDKKAGSLQKELYAAALEKHGKNNKGKYPTPAQASKLWEFAAQSAHDELCRQSGKDALPNPDGQRRKSKRQKKTLVAGVGYLLLD